MIKLDFFEKIIIFIVATFVTAFVSLFVLDLYNTPRQIAVLREDVKMIKNHIQIEQTEEGRKDNCKRKP